MLKPIFLVNIGYGILSVRSSAQIVFKAVHSDIKTARSQCLFTVGPIAEGGLWWHGAADGSSPPHHPLLFLSSLSHLWRRTHSLKLSALLEIKDAGHLSRTQWVTSDLNQLGECLRKCVCVRACVCRPLKAICSIVTSSRNICWWLGDICPCEDSL